MQLKDPKVNPDESASQWEKELQGLFRSLSKEWGDTREAKKIEDLHPFMAKWVEGVQELCDKENIIPGKEQLQENLSKHTCEIPNPAEAPPAPLPLRPAVKQGETDALLNMIEKMHLDDQLSEKEAAAPPFSLLLEIKDGTPSGLQGIPVHLKNLYPQIIILQVDKNRFLRDSETLQAKEAVLHLTESQSQKTTKFQGSVSWTQSKAEHKILLSFKMRDEKSYQAIRHNLEDCLPDASKAHQLLWNLWDKTQKTEHVTPEDKKTNFYLLLLACGTLWTSFVDPFLFQTMQCILAALGSGKIIKKCIKE